MTVSADKKPVVLIVHGVQLGNDSSLDQDKVIRKLIESRLTGTPLAFDVDLYKYENLSDAALDKFKNLSRVIMGSGIGAILAPSIIDLVGDVTISLANSSTANAIRKGLRDKIMSHYEAGSPLYVVAHSLGSVYIFDVLNELISKRKDLFDCNDPRTWPVQGLITIGSPLGLSMFKKSGRKVARNLGKGEYQLTWLNYFDVTDPVVSGNIFGKKLSKQKIAEQYKKSSFGLGWFIQDIQVDTGKNWLFAHTAYWDSAVVGDGLVNMMT
jgi:hypothetical protein